MYTQFMKTQHCVSIVLAFVLFQVSQAQTELAVFAGSQFNRFQQEIKDYPEEDLHAQIRYHFGVRADHKLSERFALRTSLAYMRKGASLDYEGSEDLDGWEYVDGYDRYILNYLHIPVQLAFNSGNFSFLVGPYAGVALSARNKYDVDWRIPDFFGNSSIENFSGDDEIKPIFRKVKDEDYEDAEAGFIRGLDLGVDFGLSYRMGDFEASVFFSQGLRNIMAKEEGFEDEYNDYVLRNQNFGMSLAYFILSNMQPKDD